MRERRVERSRELPINILHLLEFVTATACWALLADFFHLALESHSGLQTINNQLTARRNIRSGSCVRECIWQKLNFLFSSFKYGSIRRFLIPSSNTTSFLSRPMRGAYTNHWPIRSPETDNQSLSLKVYSRELYLEHALFPRPAPTHCLILPCKTHKSQQRIIIQISSVCSKMKIKLHSEHFNICMASNTKHDTQNMVLK